MKYNLEDTELQELADKLKEYVQNEYKDDADGIPEHVLNALAQNFVINHKNEHNNLDKLFDDNQIPQE